MSHQSFRKKTRTVLTNMDFKFIQSENKINKIKNYDNKNNNVTYLNSSNNCKACGHDCSFDIETKRVIPLEKHHVTYFPQRVAFVHTECHFAIHHKGFRADLKKYDDGDSRKFYDLEKKLSKENRWGTAA
jgi:hypothetical protein